MGIPIIAAVYGYAITGGFLLPYCWDLVVAAENVKFDDTHAKFALLPTGGGSIASAPQNGIAEGQEADVEASKSAKG